MHRQAGNTVCKHIAADMRKVRHSIPGPLFMPHCDSPIVKGRLWLCRQACILVSADTG